MRATFLLGLAVLTGACATGGTGAGDAGMAYGVPEGGSLTYVFGDSLFASVDVPGMGSIDLDFEQSMTLGLSFAPSASGAAITGEFQEYSATLTNPVAGTSRASSSDVTGAMAFTLDAQGRANLTDSPDIKGAAAMLLRPLGVANELLPRLPGHSVTEGDTWTDSIQFSAETPVGNIESSWVGTFTVAGTVERDGVTLTRVDSSGEYSVSTAGDLQGMYVEQNLSGPSTGYFLWDPARRVVVYHQAIRELEGSVDADAAPGPMDMTARSIVKTTLRN
jgi:hypothetical protein